MYGALVLGFFVFLNFLLFQANGIFTGDSGDLVTAAALGGVPHPPGYPLYTWLGYVVSHIPMNTVSWRVTLLSSIPHAVTVALVYALIFRMTKRNTFAGIFGSMTLALNYLFFLYSTTPEVFALFDMFVIGVWYALYRWVEEKRASFFYAFSFLYGLSLSHHHLMLFFIPAIVFFVWSNRVLLNGRGKESAHIFFGLLCMAAGFLPYIYIPFAAHRDSIINWDRAVDWKAFIQLITRADYGTFVSGSAFGQTMKERVLAIAAYGTFMRIDWTWVGIAFVGLGVYDWFRSVRIWAWTWLLAVLFLGPFFFFYASFPLLNRFALGTYERFLLPTYVLFAVAAGVGFSCALRMFDSVLKHYIASQKRSGIVSLIGLTFLLYPLIIGVMTMWRFWGLPHDRTAEMLGRDILATSKQNAIVLLGQDTPLFSTQYVRYVLGIRPDVVVIHSARLALMDYQLVLKKHFPDLRYPDISPGQFMQQFIVQNSGSRHVYSNTILPLPADWYWVSRGLLYEAVAYDDLPSVDDAYAEFLKIKTYLHSPREGLLSRYPHLMLSDVLDVYAKAYIAIGKTMVRADKWEEAQREFAKAVSLSGDMSHIEALELLAVTQLYAKDCAGALSSVKKAQSESYYRSTLHLKLESMTYGECLGDEKRAADLFSEYEKLQKESEQPLETL